MEISLAGPLSLAASSREIVGISAPSPLPKPLFAMVLSPFFSALYDLFGQMKIRLGPG